MDGSYDMCCWILLQLWKPMVLSMSSWFTSSWDDFDRSNNSTYQCWGDYFKVFHIIEAGHSYD